MAGNSIDLSDQVAIVTGAGAGIGRGIAIQLARHGASVAVADINPETGEETASLIRKSDGQARFAQTDVGQEASIENCVRQAMQQEGRIDILVNNAGSELWKPVHETRSEEWDHLMAIDLKALYLSSRLVIPHMLKQGRGCIIHISSVQGLASAGGNAAYAAAKAGVIGLTSDMAQDLGPKGIRVNAICPGSIDTPMFERGIAQMPDPALARRLSEAAIPMKRLGLPEEIGKAAVFLASDYASYVHGSLLVVDGGMTACLHVYRPAEHPDGSS